jgi:hypothetical protein
MLGWLAKSYNILSMDQFVLQKEILKKISKIIGLTDEINQELSNKLITKSRAIGIELTQDLKERCAHYLTEPIEREKYSCKVCGEKFNDGRKLGGHVSRAHKGKSSKEIPTRLPRKTKRCPRRNHDSSGEEASLTANLTNMKIE